MASYCLAYMHRGCSDLLNLIIMLLIKDEKPLVKHRQWRVRLFTICSTEMMNHYLMGILFIYPNLFQMYLLLV